MLKAESDDDASSKINDHDEDARGSEEEEEEEAPGVNMCIVPFVHLATGYGYCLCWPTVSIGAGTILSVERGQVNLGAGAILLQNAEVKLAMVTTECPYLTHMVMQEFDEFQKSAGTAGEGSKLTEKWRVIQSWDDCDSLVSGAASGGAGVGYVVLQALALSLMIPKYNA